MADNDLDDKREQFGNRHLTQEKNVFDFNAWYKRVNMKAKCKFCGRCFHCCYFRIECSVLN